MFRFKNVLQIIINGIFKIIGCVCDILGTDASKGPCNRTTGECHCLPNVQGDSCNECKPEHWKIASGEGCEACDCDDVGSRSRQCNLVCFQLSVFNACYLCVIVFLPVNCSTTVNATVSRDSVEGNVTNVRLITGEIPTMSVSV